MKRYLLRLSCLLIPLLLLTGCKDDPAGPPPPGDDLFSRYIALGNSISAGFQSDGINDSTQAQAYPVLLAARAGASFNVARLQKPGCPAPLLEPFPLSAARLAGAAPDACSGFISPIPSLVQNLSFPGFKIADALTVPGGAQGIVYRQALGNRSLVTVMAESDPTIVSVGLGNNDALSAMTSGDVGMLTPLADFRTSLSAIAAAILGEATVQDAVLVGVTNPLLAPLAQPGAYLWVIAESTGDDAFLEKPVHDDCAPRTAAGEVNALAGNLVSLRVLLDVAVIEISCADDAPYVLTAAEQAAIAARVEEYNTALREVATENQWIYVDSNELGESLLSQPDRIRKCQDLDIAASMDAIRLAVTETCPVPSAPNFFGTAVSHDGVHPTLEGHEILSDALFDAIVQKHGTS